MVSGSGKRRRLGELLIEAGVLDATRLQAALAEQKKWGGKLGRTLVEMGFVDEESMVLALSRQLKLPVVDLDAAKLPQNVTHILTVDLCERYGVFPLGADVRTKQLQLATSDPTNVEALNEIAFKTGYKVQTAVASGSAIDRAVRRLYYGETTRPTKTATPEGFGLQEPTFGAEEISGIVTGSRTGATSGVVDAMAEINSAVRDAELNRLKDRVTALEKRCDGQMRAMRALVEVLVDAGLITREDYLAKASQT